MKSIKKSIINKMNLTFFITLFVVLLPICVFADNNLINIENKDNDLTGEIIIKNWTEKNPEFININTTKTNREVYNININLSKYPSKSFIILDSDIMLVKNYSKNHSFDFIVILNQTNKTQSLINFTVNQGIINNTTKIDLCIINNNTYPCVIRKEENRNFALNISGGFKIMGWLNQNVSNESDSEIKQAEDKAKKVDKKSEKLDNPKPKISETVIKQVKDVLKWIFKR